MEIIWDGVYESLESVPSTGDGFNGKTWLDKSLQRMQILKAELAAKDSVQPRPQCTESMLPLVAAIITSIDSHVRVLDFGGGLGEAYFKVRAGLPNSAGLHFDIIELPEACAAGRIFHGQNGPGFLEEIPITGTEYDITHFGSSIHYVSDWKGVLADLSRLTRRYIAFTDLPAGDIPTYASAQLYYDSRIPVWFFNLKEFVAYVCDLGFKPVWRSRYVGPVLGCRQSLPQENFDHRFRLGSCSNLLFQRGSK